MKLLGLMMLVCCGAVGGELMAAVYRDMLGLLVTTSDMLLQLEIIMDYEAPAVPDMLREIKRIAAKLPVFLDSFPDGGGANELLSKLSMNEDGYAERDLHRLEEYFAQLGTADRLSELKRLEAVRAYFNSRIEEEKPLAAKRIKLARSLGLLGGIFVAVMLI